MTSKLRKRKNNNEDQRNGTPKNSGKVTYTKGKSPNGIYIFLIGMVVIVWGIAATSYFGIINYKTLFARTSAISSSDVSSYLNPTQHQVFHHPLRYIGQIMIKADDYFSSFFDAKEHLHYIDKQRAVAADMPIQKNSFSMEPPSRLDRSVEEQSVKETKPVETLQEKQSEGTTIKTDTAQKEKPQLQKDKIEKENKVKPTEQKPKNKSTKKTAVKDGSGKDMESNPLNSMNDEPILKELDKGEALLQKKKGRDALAFFKKLLISNPNSPRALYGKARAMLVISELERSNQWVQEGIASLEKVLTESTCPNSLLKVAALLKVDKQLFMGQMREALKTAVAVYKKLPRDVQVMNKLGVVYLYLGRNESAKKIYQRALKFAPKDGFALVHYGFILKTTDKNMEEGAKHLQAGIDSMEEGTQEGKFYMHLGDALHRINKTTEAEAIYQLGADRRLFKSKYQRSLYNVDHLKSRPFWTAKQAKVTSYVNSLEKNWKLIRDEALSMMDADKGMFLPEEENLKNTGDWKQLTLFARGREEKDCKRLPKTCSIIKKMPNAIGCKRGQIKFSIMAPGTHVWAHTGPTNCRLRMHLGLVIPQTGQGARLRCADQYRTWEEGKVMIFDDSFEHEVWQYAESYRLILIVDVWHPDLSENEKRTLTPI